MSADEEWSWRSLTHTLADRSSTPRRLLDDVLASLAVPVRDRQRTYRESAHSIVVPRGTSNLGTLGSAFDIWVQLTADSPAALTLTTVGARLAGDDVADAFRQLLSLHHARPEHPFKVTEGPHAQEARLQVAWVCALLTEVYRVGMIWPGSVLDTDDPIENAEQLLGLATPDAVQDLRALTDLAQTQLLPALRDLAGRGPTHLGPTFTGSALMAADADLVVGHTLVELKTQLSRLRPDRTRVLSLESAVLRQVLGYLLHDHDDRFGIDTIALYQARYGELTIWPVNRLFRPAGGPELDLTDLRRQWVDVLRAGPSH